MSGDPASSRLGAIGQGYQGLLSCDDCRVCGNQLEGYNSIGYGKGYGWDDLAFCPDNYEALGGPSP